MEGSINNTVMLHKQCGEEKVIIANGGGSYRVVIVYATDGHDSCERMYGSPEEVKEGFEKDWWRIFNIYTPEELIKLMYPV
jgi:hypothetical protein